MFTKVPIKEFYKVTGRDPIDTKWVDVNKGDKDNPEIRCRWVGREFKGNDKHRDNVYASTPPLEAKKILMSMAASQLDTPIT